MSAFECPLATPPDKAHAFAPFAADIQGENRTLAVIFCQMCGEMRNVEPTVHINEDAPDWAARMAALKERAGE